MASQNNRLTDEQLVVAQNFWRMGMDTFDIAKTIGEVTEAAVFNSLAAYRDAKRMRLYGKAGCQVVMARRI